MKTETFFDPTEIRTPLSDDLALKWKEDRLGKFTSSALNKIFKGGRRDMTKAELEEEKKNGGKRKTVDTLFGDGALSYIYAKIGETLTLETNEITTKAMEWGNEHEAGAVEMFARVTGFDVVHFGKANPVFFPYAEDPDHAGGSPDGEIESEDAVVEIKCPFESSNHARVLHQIKKGSFSLKEYDEEYYGQVQANMFFTGRKKAYFVSYDPRVLDIKYAVAYVLVERDEEYIAELKTRLDEAIKIKKQFLTDLGYYEEDVVRPAA
jgi:hypothetical protein